MKFLVTRTTSFYDDAPWREDVDVVDEMGYVERRVHRLPGRLQARARLWYQMQFGLYLLFRCSKYDGIAVGRYGIWFPVLQHLIGMRRRIVMTDTEWRELRGGRLNRAAARASTLVCSNTRVEIERYSRHYNIPREKFRLVHLAYQERDQRQAMDQGYVFSGGIQGRDWETFVKAVDGLPYSIKVFTDGKLPHIPSNTTVQFVGRSEFYSEMAAASCVVITLHSEPLRITGTTTWTNAMGMGKVVIVTEPLGAPDYMDQGVSGLYVGYRDAGALRECIERVMRDADLRRRVGEAARERARSEFSPSVFRQRILALLEEREEAATQNS